MRVINSIIYLIAILITFLLVIGCEKETVEPENTFTEVEIIDENINGSDTETEVAGEIITRIVKADRLPGSLKIGSMVIYKSGEDFLADHPEGLKVVTSYTVKTTQSSSASSGNSSSSVTSSTQTEPSGTSESGSSAGGSSIVIDHSGGGETMRGTVTGQGSITTTTTITFD